ncbi:MAG: glycosyltransferase [Rhodospirillales bacterium]|nr:glycosyltransferase [Rhodospirillales bacterium]
MNVSVIVCTRNRAHAITPCLDSMVEALKTVDIPQKEIIVVDNGSEDDTAARVTAWAENCPVPFRLLSEPRKGVSRARNMAVREAKGDLLIFTDDDCRLDKNHVRDALKHAEADKIPTVRGGRIELPDPTDLRLTFKTDPDIQTWERSQNDARYKTMRGAVSGCNMAFPRKIIETVGFFSERLGPGTFIPGSEDTDFIYRVYLAGFPVQYVPDMTVYHAHGRKTAEEGKKLLSGYFIGSGAVYLKYLFIHPNFCRPFIWDIKNLIREIKAGESLYIPEYGLSFKYLLLCNLKGMGLYLRALLTPQP